ncbi:diguanylate cyclase [Magnetococcales bacterium HHB-1]
MDKQQKILLVDDAPQNIQVLNAILGQDYTILFSTNGQDALYVSQQQKPDLILLDILMPEMDGFEVCQKLKKNPLTREIPVIFVTSMSEEQDEAKGFDLGAVDYIQKPIRPAIVKARVKTHLELKQQRDVLERLSTLDGLTGIANRRQFDKMLEQEWRRAIRTKGMLSLVMMDIDFFKKYNDHYGHSGGDHCLRQVAQTLEKSLDRVSDSVSRYGGEEFACILPETPLAGAVLVAEKLRLAVLKMDIPHRGSLVADQVTMSMGIHAMIPTPESAPQTLIDKADAMLYRAKEAGRNGIFTPEMV